MSKLIVIVGITGNQASVLGRLSRHEQHYAFKAHDRYYNVPTYTNLL